MNLDEATEARPVGHHYLQLNTWVSPPLWPGQFIHMKTKDWNYHMAWPDSFQFHNHIGS